MTRSKGAGVVLLAAVAGSLVVGCGSGNGDTAPATVPPVSTSAAEPTVDAGPLQGYWRAEGMSGWGPVRLNLLVPGRWFAWEWDDVGNGTYGLDGDTITWLGGDTCAVGAKGTYSYALEDGQFTLTLIDDPCLDRRYSFDGRVFRRTTPDPATRTVSDVMTRLALSGIETEVVRYSDPESFRGHDCHAHVLASASDSAAVVLVEGTALLFDDPDLDLDKASKVLGVPATPVNQFCGPAVTGWPW